MNPIDKSIYSAYLGVETLITYLAGNNVQARINHLVLQLPQGNTILQDIRSNHFAGVGLLSLSMSRLCKDIVVDVECQVDNNGLKMGRWFDERVTILVIMNTANS